MSQMQAGETIMLVRYDIKTNPENQPELKPTTTTDPPPHPNLLLIYQSWWNSAGSNGFGTITPWIQRRIKLVDGWALHIMWGRD